MVGGLLRLNARFRISHTGGICAGGELLRGSTAAPLSAPPFSALFQPPRVGDEHTDGYITYHKQQQNGYNKNNTFKVHNGTSSLCPDMRREQQKQRVYLKPAEKHGKGQNQL